MFFEFSASDVVSTTAHITEIVNNAKPLILLIGGLIIGLYVLGRLIGFFRDLNKTKSE